MITIQSIRQAWAVLWGRLRIVEGVVVTRIESDVDALRRRIERFHFAAKLMELPMAFADEIATLDKEITDALAAKDAAGQADKDALAAATTTITSLQAQVADQETQLAALVAKYAPPAPVVEPVTDPALGG